MRRSVRTAIHTTLFWGYFFLSMPFFFAGALVLYVLTLPFDPNGRVLHQYTCFWGGHYVFVNPMWRLEITGRERLEKGRAYVFCVNHQSAGDIPVLFATFLPFKFVSKAANFRAPFLGWNMALNRYVRLVRGDLSSASMMMKACGRWLERGVSVLMFPEGTRSKTGRFLPFKLGAFTMSVQSGAPVVPIVIDGSIDAVPPDGILRQKGIVRVRVCVGDPVAPGLHADAKALMAEVRNQMERTQAELWKRRGYEPVHAAPEPARSVG